MILSDNEVKIFVMENYPHLKFFSRPGNFYCTMYKKPYLVSCPECKSENYAPSVATGICGWCGWQAKKEFDQVKELK